LIRTVLGDVPARDLGVCDAHDHLFFRSAQLPGLELADADAALGELRAFAALGGRAVVQWTPFGLGRRADQFAAVSRAADVAGNFHHLDAQARQEAAKFFTVNPARAFSWA
jgi:predicted metal-dependent phosphotriesterase family hydrolase